jgi:hypothetical protein
VKLASLAAVVVASFCLIAVSPASAGSSSAAQQYKHARDVLRFFDHHPALAKTPAGQVAIKKHTRLLHWAASHLAPSWPPHHQLWLCIHSGEAGWHQPSYAKDANGVSLYWGGMQMHAGWGYGTSYHASDDSQMTQEWAAERAYKASGYSSTFLWQQWAADARCF